MQRLLQQLEAWIRGILVAGIMRNLNNTFQSVNDQVASITTRVGQSPESFSPRIYQLISNLSENMNLYDGIATASKIDGKWVFTQEEFLAMLYNPWNCEKQWRVLNRFAIFVLKKRFL